MDKKRMRERVRLVFSEGVFNDVNEVSPSDRKGGVVRRLVCHGSPGEMRKGKDV